MQSPSFHLIQRSLGFFSASLIRLSNFCHRDSDSVGRRERAAPTPCRLPPRASPSPAAAYRSPLPHGQRRALARSATRRTRTRTRTRTRPLPYPKPNALFSRTPHVASRRCQTKHPRFMSPVLIVGPGNKHI
ncbi:hypothetical protein L209DRAFT_486651 [Thermothelomyces heterothallicus CBS 203.75]